MRAILRPGTHVLRRGTGQLQVGLDPATALVLTASPQVRADLGQLVSPGGASASSSASDGPVVGLLSAHHQLVDSDHLLPLLGGGVAVSTAAAVVRQSGDDAPLTLAARGRCRTDARSFGHPAGQPLRDSLEALVRAAGLGTATDPAASSPTSPTDCGVLLGVGEPDRELVDGWTRAGTPHLLVRLTEGRAVIGPFVEPGATACLRCVDAHCQDADPSWPLLVRQYAAASARDRGDGAPEPVDPLLAALAVAWAARDLASYVDGGRPSTWSATVTLHPQLSEIETRRWLRHPGCGCSWT